MAILTELSQNDARRVGSLFGLDVAAAEGLLAGSVNSNYRLTLADGSALFLRIYEEQAAENAETEARMLEHLALGGVRTARPIKRLDGSLLASHRGKPVALFSWVEGRSLCQKQVTPQSARAVGDALARMHLAGESFQGAPANRFSRDALLARIERLPWATLPLEIHDAATEVKRHLQSAPPRARESLGIVHGDLFRDNVLWSGGLGGSSARAADPQMLSGGLGGSSARAADPQMLDGDVITALLDFESACSGSASFDLAVTLLSWCYAEGLDRELARALVAGYASARPLRGDERDQLFDEARFVTLRFAATRITDYELRPRGLSGYRDFRRFLDRRRAIERMGPDGFLAFLGV